MAFEKTQEEVVNEISQTLEQVNSQDIDTFIELLTSARRVFFVGVGV